MGIIENICILKNSKLEGFLEENKTWDSFRINIPNTVREIGDRCFADCSSLYDVKLPTSLSVIGNYLFTRCMSLRELVIPDFVQTIGNSAFCGCSSLYKVNIPRGLKKFIATHLKSAGILREVV